MDASNIPKGQSPERTDGRPINLPGIYVHKETGAKYITAEGEEGVTQADALMADKWQGGWERVGDVPTRVELQKMRKAQEVKDAAAEKLAKEEEEAEMAKAVEEAVKEAKEEKKKASKE